MEYLAYLLKQRAPRLFLLMERVACWVVNVQFGSRVTAAASDSLVEGAINGQPAQMRAVYYSDFLEIKSFLDDLPADWLKYFNPHSFEADGLKSVLHTRAFLKYGLFVDKRLQGYALLKLAPTGSAFIGLLVHPDLSGLGLGKFIVEYLYWQASLAGLRTRSTISKSNTASLRSHGAVADYKIIAELPNDYIMIEFPAEERSKPELRIP